MLNELENLHRACFPSKPWTAQDFADLKKSGCDIIASQNGFIVYRAVADEAAQAASNLLYDSGVKVMWSFSSGPLYKPLDAVVQYENLALSLAHLKMQALDLPERRNV